MGNHPNKLKRMDVQMSKNKYYVTMNDTFTTRLRSDGRTDKIIVECDTLDEVGIVMENVKNRTDMKYVNYHNDSHPYYNPNKFDTHFKTKEDYPMWFVKDYFQEVK